MSSQIPIFVISLARAPERRADISRHLERHGLTYTIVDAVDGKLLPADELERLQAPGLHYVPGVVGCYLSHIGVYQRILDENIPVALVLEDDALLNPAFAAVLKTGISMLDFDYCLLDCDDCSENTPAFYDPDSARQLAPGFPVYETNIGPALLHAYLMTREGARKRVAQAWPIKKPVDVYSHLLDPPRILVCVDPKGAAVSEHSRQSFTSDRHDTEPMRLRFLRRFPWFFTLRDWLKLQPLKRWRQIAKLQREGKLSKTCRWRPMPSGRNITYW